MQRETTQIGERTYRITDTGKPRRQVSGEPTSPVYEGGVILEVRTNGSWGYIDRFDDRSDVQDFFRLARRHAAQRRSSDANDSFD